MANKGRQAWQKDPSRIMRGENHPAFLKNKSYFKTGADHHMTKLTEEKVIEMRRLLMVGEENYYTIGPRFGVANMTAWHACHRRGRTWRKLPFPPDYP